MCTPPPYESQEGGAKEDRTVNTRAQFKVFSLSR